MSTTYQQGSTPTSIASGLASSINGNGSSPVNASASGATVNLTAKTTGASTNYSLSSTSSTNLPGTFSVSFTATPSGSALTGGTDQTSSLLTGAAITTYTYDLNNNLTGVTAATGPQTRSYQYDKLSRVIQKTEPETGTTNFYYTTSGGTLCSGDPSAVCRRTDARNITITYGYDSLNRLTSKTYNDTAPTTPAVTFYYDQTSYNGLTITNGKGRRTGMSDGSGQTAWSFDQVGNTTTEQRTINGVTKTISYTYNLDGSISSVTYPGGRKVSYTVGNAQRPTAASDTTNGINYASASSLAMYAPTGVPASIVYGYASGGGITETRSYNNRLELTGIQAVAGGTIGTVLNLAYSYAQSSHNNGNIATQTNNVDTGRTQNYTYDNLNRLLTAQTQATSGADCWGQSFGTDGKMATDALANLFYATSIQCSSPQPRFTMNSSPYNNEFTGTGISYDLDGDNTADTVYSYTYDAENRIITANGMAGGPYCYTYDGNGVRVEKANANGGLCTGTPTVDVLYWRSIAGNTIAETDSTGSTSNANYHEYVFFAGRRVARSDVSTGSIYYYFVDHLGSTRIMTDASGNVCFNVAYLPYGPENHITNTCNTTYTTYKFAGYERDGETGLDYALARYYNSRLGRFMSGDPLAGDTSDPQTLNRYAYVSNNPVNLIDPSGMFLCGPALCPPDTGGSPLAVLAAEVESEAEATIFHSTANILPPA
jgi:RHS repeat-associated protein